jgi:hypothetical protein
MTIYIIEYVDYMRRFSPVNPLFDAHPLSRRTPGVHRFVPAGRSGRGIAGEERGVRKPGYSRATTRGKHMVNEVPFPGALVAQM